MDVDPTWTFQQYQIYEQKRLQESLAEQEVAREKGLVIDPKSEPHGGYRIACVWPDEVTGPACTVSAQVAALLPGTPAYGYDSIHSSIGNIAAPGGRLVDPRQIPKDHELLDGLADAVKTALRDLEGVATTTDRSTTFGPALLAPRMALLFGRPAAGYWALYRAVHMACAAQELQLVPSWGPHLTLTRFAATARPGQVQSILELLGSWQPVTAAPTSIMVGYYTVAPGEFSVDEYTSFDLR